MTPEIPTISKSDEEFREEKIEFVFGREGIDLAELNDLFERVSPFNYFVIPWKPA